MKDQFRKEDRDFQQMILGNAAQQGLFGPMGNEITREVVIDQWGRKEEITYKATTVQMGPDGIPCVITEIGSRELSCSHIVHSAQQVSGRCIYGCLVCDQCPLHTCEWCGAKVCEGCVIITDDGIVLCRGHELQRLLQDFKQALLGS